VTVAPHTATAAVHAVARAVLAPEPAPPRAAASPAVQRLPTAPPSDRAILPAGYRENEPLAEPDPPALPAAQALPRDDDAGTSLPVQPAPGAATLDVGSPGVARLTEGLLQALGTAPAPGSTRFSRPGAL
jgi:hypothetical protein